MSVQTEITRLSNAKSAIKTAIGNKGVTVPSTTKLDGMATLIGQIPTGTDTSDANATASDILSGKTAYVKGTKVTGNIATKTASNLSASGKTVTVPAGYYATKATKDVATGSAATPATSIKVTPTISVSNGVITASVSASKSVTPSVSAGYVSSGTAGTISVSGSSTKQIVVQIKPFQPGSGTPSTTNVRPIYPGITVRKDDGSLLDVYGGQITFSGNTATITVTSGIFTLSKSLLDWFIANYPTYNGYSAKYGGLWLRNLHYSDNVTRAFQSYASGARNLCTFAEACVVNNSSLSSSQYRTSFKGAWTSWTEFYDAVVALEDSGKPIAYVADYNNPYTYTLTKGQLSLK